MPKSGFDPQRHQRKIHRHNPLATPRSANPQSNGVGVGAASSTSSNKSVALDALRQSSKIQSVTASNDSVVPLLANLPSPSTSSATTAPIDLADKVWALASVSLLLTVSQTQSASEVKHNRKLLLSHDLIARLLFALQSHTEIDVKREASGALRNLCVDAGIDVRNELVNKGGIDVILSSLKWASQSLGFHGSASLPHPSQAFPQQAPKPEQDLESKRALLAKSLDQMNKKEKRHATKIATFLGKPLEELAGKPLSSEDQRRLVQSNSQDADMGSASSTSHQNHGSASSSANMKGEPFLSLDLQSRKGLLEMCENLATIIWCLCESGDKAFSKLVGWRWLDQDQDEISSVETELSGESLASWLCSALSLGSRAAKVLSTSSDDGTRTDSSTDTLSALSNDELSLLLDLALASANALCGLTDGGEPEFIDGFLSRISPKPSKKGSRSAQPISTPIATSAEQQLLSASNRLSQIHGIVMLLQACVASDQAGTDKLKRFVLTQTTMLGTLATGILRNLAAAVDTKSSSSSSKARRKAESMTSSNIFLPSPSDQNAWIPLSKYEEVVVLPTLTRLLANVNVIDLAHDLEGRGDASATLALDQNEGATESDLRAKMQIKAEEKAQTLLLALEILAEMAVTLDSKRADASDDDEWLEDMDADGSESIESDEVDMEQDMEAVLGDDDAEPENDEQWVENGQEDAAMGDAQDTFAEAVKRGGSMPFEAYAPTLCHVLTEAHSQSLAGCLLTLARPFEASFASLLGSSPQSTDSPAQASSLLRGMHERSLSVLNNLLLRLATFAPPPPSQPAADPKQQRRIAAFRTWTSGAAQAQLSTTFRTLFEIARGCASVPAVAVAAAAGPGSTDDVSQSVSVSSGSFQGGDEATDGLKMIETCIGAMWSLARCVEGNVAVSWSEEGHQVTVSQPESVQGEVIQALMTGYTTARSEGMRAKCLGLLSVIGRCSAVHVELNHLIGSFLIERLEAIPENASKVPSSSSPETLVASINGLIDMYADETSHHDQVFRTNNFLPRIRMTLFRCKILARQIDKRKQISLRASAEEAIENLHGFVQYRQSLKLQ